MKVQSLYSQELRTGCRSQCVSPQPMRSGKEEEERGERMESTLTISRARLFSISSLCPSLPVSVCLSGVGVDVSDISELCWTVKLPFIDSSKLRSFQAAFIVLMACNGSRSCRSPALLLLLCFSFRGILPALAAECIPIF